EEPRHPRIIFLCEFEKPCRWRTSDGIGFGTSLKELERRNGKPFEMMGWGTNVEGYSVGGDLTSFHGGPLGRQLSCLVLTLTPQTNDKGDYVPTLSAEELAAVQGEILSSSHPVLQKLNPRVGFMRMEFPLSTARKQR